MQSSVDAADETSKPNQYDHRQTTVVKPGRVELSNNQYDHLWSTVVEPGRVTISNNQGS